MRCHGVKEPNFENNKRSSQFVGNATIYNQKADFNEKVAIEIERKKRLNDLDSFMFGETFVMYPFLFRTK